MKMDEGDTIEIKDGEVNVEEIMKDIRARIKHNQKQHGDKYLDPGTVEMSPASADKELSIFDIAKIEHNLHFVNVTCGKKATIHRLLGKIPYLRAIIAGADIQSDFNVHSVIVLNTLFETQKQLLEEMKELRESNKGIPLSKSPGVLRKIDGEKPPIIRDADMPDINYFDFERMFRGKTEDIKLQQTQFLKHFTNCKNVLDVGCGRGEFLKLLEENNSWGYGIDIDDDMVDFTKKQGLVAIRVDATTHMRSLADNTLDGVFMSHVAEHLEPSELLTTLNLAYKKLKWGSNLVLVTPNPRSLSIFYNSFYLDLSHVKPLHPYTLEFILKGIGFGEIELRYLSPLPEELALKKLESSEKNKVLNDNIQKLNDIVFGYQDYAIIAQK
jgi:SAM-dependent methyltransferase